jgi:hypothetical protein
MSEYEELQEILNSEPVFKKDDNKKAMAIPGYPALDCCSDKKTDPGALVQWTTSDNNMFFPANHTTQVLPCGVYEIAECQRGIYFEKVPIKTEGLVRFPQTNSNKVLEEIQTFWTKESRFRSYDLSYKRGIMLWGPAGGGKSSTIQLIMKDVIDRSGIVIKFTHPTLFISGIRILRQVQPDTPVVIIMEDIDAILENFNESSVLNILDGCEQLDKIVFLATTNYPERLGARIVNRPSRFDKRFKIGYPNIESRRLYFESLMHGDMDKLGVNLEQWVKDTKGFSLAHLKELFVAVCILGDDYKETICTLESMRERLHSDDDESSQKVGFIRSDSHCE